MKNFNLILVLIASILLNQSFSQTISKTSEFESITIQTSKNTNGSKNYCPSTFTNITDDSITNVTFNTINNNSGQEGADSYGDYTSMATGLLVGNTYTLSVTFISGSYTQHVWAWIDWNGDEDFNDISEHYDLGEGTSTTITFPISVPYTGYTGFTRMRITEQYNTDPNPCDPQSNNYGETEDYLLYVFANNYCSASGGCDEFISEVELYSAADNIVYYSSGCLGYFEWMTPIIQLPINSNGLITVTNGNPYEDDQCGAWVDWNNNDIFDTYEALTVSGSPGEGPYTAYIIPPSGTLLGSYNLRTRIVYSDTPTPCGTGTYGEVEDFHFNITPEIAVEWTGAFDNNWHNPDNWNTLKVPDATTDVIIQDTPNKCWVWAGPAFCKNMTVENGSGYTLRIWDQYLDVSGNMNIYGQLLMDHADGSIDAHGDIIWESGSSASIQANTIIEVSGDWIFKSGANVNLNDGQIAFTGSGNSYIRTFEDNCYFNHLVVFKTGSDWAGIGSTNTADMHIHGDLVNQVNSNLFIYTPESVIVSGNLLNFETLIAYDGSIVFNGDDQMIFGDAADPPTVFYNLTINSTISTNLSSNGITVNGNLTIEHGEFISNGYPISVGRDWNNHGPGAGAAFIADTGRVIFNGGNYHQYCSDEYFNILEINKPLGGAFRMQGTHVECASYDWTAGAIDVIPGGGSFTALDLYDDAIYGEYYLNLGGTINLHQDTDPLSYTDLNGELHIFGGIMNVYGGTGPSYWSFAGDAWISMSDGVLDFHDQGIYAWQSATHTLTENISGGTIRTAYGFWADSPSFTPEHGTIEFYSTNDADIFTINGSNLNHVLINKAPKKENSEKTKSANNIPLIDERSGKTISNGSKSNTISLYDFLDINGNLVIDNGVLNSAGNNIQIAGDWTNNVGPSGFMESTGNVTFDGANGAVIWTGETFANLYLDKTFAGIEALELADGTTVNVLGELFLSNGNLEMNPYSLLKVDGNLFIAIEAGLNADDGFNEIEVGGDWTNENTSYNLFEGFTIGGEVVIFNGTLDQHINTNASQEDFTNIIIDKTSGNFRPNDNIRVDGGLQILDGDWFDYTPSLTHYWNWHVLIGIDGNYYPQGTTIFSGTVDQTYTNNGGTAMFRDLIIDKSGILFLNSDMVVHYGNTTNVDAGTLNLNGNWFKGTGDININNGGEIFVDAGSHLSIVENLYVNSGGFLTVSGTEGNNATIFIDGVGNYGFEVNANGSISANYTTFYGMNQNGIWVEYGAYVDPDNAFNNCTFGLSEYGVGSSRLTINNDQLLYIDNVSFIDNPYFSGSFNVGKDLDYGELIISNYKGNFSGPDYEDDYYNRIHWYPGEYRLELKAFLEGPFNSTFMSPGLNSILPLNHPFNPPLPYFGNPFPDWYYNIAGVVPFIPDPSVVDWVLVQLRDATSPATALPATTIATTPAFLKEDGSIIALDGSSQLTFELTLINDIYVAIWHRNHLGIISANPLTDVGGIFPYDFSSSANQAYGGLSAQIQLSAVPEIWGMIAGDGDGSGDIDNPDKNNIWNIQAGEKGYLESDYNLNIDVNNQDKNDFWNKNNGKATYIPD